MPTLSSITDQTKSGSVSIGSEVVEFTYKPYAVTLDVAIKLSEGESSYTDLLPLILASWNITDPNGNAFPPTIDNVKQVPLEVASEIVKVVTGGEDEGEAKGSFNGS